MARRGSGETNPPKEKRNEVESGSAKVPAEEITEELPKANENPQWWKGDGSNEGEVH